MARLLIVDDDQSTLASLARAFRLSGHEATVCDNAGKAIDLVRSGTFDMILSDVVMPGKDGLCHISELAVFRVKNTEVVVKMGDIIKVKCIGIDDKGRVKLSRKAAMKDRNEAAEKVPA